MRWNIRSDAPVYSQLVEHIKLAIVSGEFPLGSRLPSVRELAADAGVNPNTMQRAFAELEREGLVLTQRTAGRTVTEDALRIEAVKRRLASAAIQTFWVSMRLLGFDQSEALQMLAESGKKEREEWPPATWAPEERARPASGKWSRAAPSLWGRFRARA